MALKQISLLTSRGNTLAVTPSKLVCIGRNYVEHIQELGNELPDDMVVFIKPNSAIATRLASYHQEPLHYEAELCFMVEDGRLSAVGLGLDLTKRGLQNTLKAKGLPWERAKAFNGSAVFSPFISLDTLADSDTQAWCFELTIDGVMTQWGHSELMMYSPEGILDSLKEFIDLVDGDIIMTGTPKGVGQLVAGSEYQLRLWQAKAGVTPYGQRDEIKVQPQVISQLWRACE